MKLLILVKRCEFNDGYVTFEITRCWSIYLRRSHRSIDHHQCGPTGCHHPLPDETKKNKQNTSTSTVHCRATVGSHRSLGHRQLRERSLCEWRKESSWAIIASDHGLARSVLQNVGARVPRESFRSIRVLPYRADGATKVFGVTLGGDCALLRNSLRRDPLGGSAPVQWRSGGHAHTGTTALRHSFVR